jgi:uncharacterized caspase-like protein
LLDRNADASKNFDVRLVTDPPESVTRASLREALDDLFRQPAEVALFYFSGHGSENDLGGFLVTTDARAYDEGVAMADVISLANRSTVTEVVILLDCCHSGHLGNVPQGPREMNQRAEIREGVSIITASRSSEAALETHGRGLFTTLLCAGLDGGASDVLGQTSVAGLFAYVDQSLGAWQQRPLFKSHISSLLSLRQAAAAVTAERLRRLPEFFPAPDTEFHLDPTYEETSASAIGEHVADYQVLVAYRNARLIDVVGEEHLYYAAMRNGTVRLTALGRHYRRLADEDRL